ncbi:MAG: FkbM family methyltransferase [Alphaproteobacteria bacterium]
MNHGSPAPTSVGFKPYVANDLEVGPYRYSMWIADPVAETWYSGKDQNLPERCWCLNHLREGMTVADCGAHHGSFSILFSKAIGPRGRVIAWEALPENAEVARQNLILNECVNAEMRPYALGDIRGQLSLHDDGGNTNRRVDWSGTGEVRVRVVPLDEDAQDIAFDFMKIDVEGSDLQMLRGARKALARRPILDLELHNALFADRLVTLSEIFSILIPLRYVYSLLPEVRGSIGPPVKEIDLAALAQIENPHLFCLPDQ